ncbi:MAG: GNAT family N-acetyltransferase [Phycisphaerales bacterium]|nr:GNAT family N-acetyltransferase [Phycisphaerales bacterium]
MGPSNDQTWVRPRVLENSEIATTVRLVPLTPAHAADLHAIADPKLFTHTMQAPSEWSVRGFAEEIEKVLAVPMSVAFAIELVRDDRGFTAGRVIGRTTYMDIKAEHRGLEIGRTWIGRPFHGTRVNPEIKYLMLRHAFESLAPTAIRVQLTTNGTNLHSQAAITKLGAVREGTLRKARIMPATAERPEPAVRDWVHFSILDDEWPGVRESLERRLRSMR